MTISTSLIHPSMTIISSFISRTRTLDDIFYLLATEITRKLHQTSPAEDLNHSHKPAPQPTHFEVALSLYPWERPKRRNIISHNPSHNRSGRSRLLTYFVKVKKNAGNFFIRIRIRPPATACQFTIPKHRRTPIFRNVQNIRVLKAKNHFALKILLFLFIIPCGCGKTPWLTFPLLYWFVGGGAGCVGGGRGSGCNNSMPLENGLVTEKKGGTKCGAV